MPGDGIKIGDFVQGQLIGPEERAKMEEEKKKKEDNDGEESPNS